MVSSLHFRNAIAYQEISENYIAQKIKRLFFVVVFQFDWHFIRCRKFSFADIGIINFHKFFFMAVRDFKLGFLQKFIFPSFFLTLGILGLVTLGWVFWSRTISLLHSVLYIPIF